MTTPETKDEEGTTPVCPSHVFHDRCCNTWFCRPESCRSVWQMCVYGCHCVHSHVLKSLCLCVRSWFKEDYFPQSWERAVPGCHTQPQSLTSTGQVPPVDLLAQGDYRRNKVSDQEAERKVANVKLSTPQSKEKKNDSGVKKEQREQHVGDVE